MNREELHEALDAAIDRKQWFHPQWEPWVKCSEEEKEQFRVMCNFMSKIHPKSLGTIDVRFEKCSPYRSINFYEPKLGHNGEFMDSIVEMALGKEESNESNS